MGKRFKLVCQWCAPDESGDYDDELEMSPTDEITVLSGEYENLIHALNHWSQVSYMTRDHDGLHITAFIYDQWMGDKMVYTSSWGYTKPREEFNKHLYNQRSKVVWGIVENGGFVQYWVSDDDYEENTIKELTRLGMYTPGVTFLKRVDTLNNVTTIERGVLSDNIS